RELRGVGQLGAQMRELRRDQAHPRRVDDEVLVGDETRCGGTKHGPRLLRYFGAMRIAPSRRIVSPLSISFRTISATSDAYSAGRPNRGGNGTILPSDSCTSFGKLVIIGVSNRPGAMVTTRMPFRASSRAIGSVSPTSPPFDALYAACPICPSYAATDAVKTITPRSPPPLGVLRAIASAARRAMLNDPIRLMLIVRANEARLCGPSLPRIFSPCTTPAQLTMPCSAPNALVAASTAALPLASSVTSVRTNIAAAPSSFASALPSRSLTSASTALPPPATTMRAVAAPKPDAPPLITNTLPRSSIVLLRCPGRSAAAREHSRAPPVPPYFSCALNTVVA